MARIAVTTIVFVTADDEDEAEEVVRRSLRAMDWNDMDDLPEDRAKGLPDFKILSADVLVNS